MFLVKRLAHSILLTLLAASCYAQQEIPGAIAVPANAAIVLHVYAKGVQVYRCTQDVKDTSHYVWTFQEPRADLFTSNDYTKKAGKHYLNTDKNPTWELSDGSIVSGTKLQQALSAESGAIPWLLLHAVSGSAKGSLDKIVFIQRLNTHGGKAPENATQAKSAQLLEVPYIAEYLFYK